MANTKNAELNVAESRDKLVADLKAVVEDAQQVIVDAKNDSIEMLSEKVKVVQESLKKSMVAMKGYEKVAIDHACEYADQTEQVIKRHPWQTVGFAVVAGLVIGRLMQHR